MDATLIFVVFLSGASNCNGDIFREKPMHFARRFVPRDISVIIGAPSYPSHLPAAEPILPGHTLIRPSLGMLKSALKFPHREQENGAGVYGNIDNLGIRYDGRNERVRYSGFRRTPTDDLMFSPTQIAYLLNDRLQEVPRRNVESNLSSRLHTSAKTLSYVDKLLRKLRSMRRQRRQKTVVTLEAGDNMDASQSYEQLENQQSPPDQNAPKSKLFWQSKVAFNNIKINPYAPNIEDFLPKDAWENDLRSWWYYHQADYMPFNEHND